MGFALFQNPFHHQRIKMAPNAGWSQPQAFCQIHGSRWARLKDGTSYLVAGAKVLGRGGGFHNGIVS
jgi:hypothetical protein